MGILDNHVALVTGGGRGLGAGIACAMAKHGAKILVCSLDATELEHTCETIRAARGIASAFVCDVTNQARVQDCVAATIEQFGAIDILVNNAALTTQTPLPLDQVSPSSMRAHFEVDVIGSANFMIACFPHMKERGGCIINLGSGAGTQGVTLNGPYSIAKEAVRGLTKIAASDWGKFGIRVNVVVPAARTQGLDAWLVDQPAGTKQRLMDSFILGRLGEAEADIGEAVAALASPLMKYMTGRTIFIDGGRGRFL